MRSITLLDDLIHLIAQIQFFGDLYNDTVQHRSVLLDQLFEKLIRHITVRYTVDEHLLRGENVFILLAVFMIFAYAFSNKKREESKVSCIPLLSGIVGTISKYSFTMFLVHHILQDRLFSKYSDKVVSTGLSAPKYFLLFFFALILTFLLSCLIQNGTDTIMKNLKARFEKRASKGAKANDQASINT